MSDPADRGSAGAQLPIVWRVSRAGLVASWAGITVAAITVLALTTLVLTSNEADLAGVLAGGGFAIFLGLLLWRTGVYPAVIATERTLIIRNPHATVTIRWPDIVEVAAGFDGVTVMSVSALTTAAWAVQKANLSTWRGSRTRADIVAAQIWELAAERGAEGPGTEGPKRLPQRQLDPIDAVREPLRFPWRMTRPEAAVIGFLRHSSSPWLTLATAVLFGGLGVLNAWFVGVDQWDGYVLASRGVTVEATVVAVPGLIEVTWPTIRPRTIFLDTPAKDAASVYAAGQVVEVVSDPQRPTRARLAGFSPRPWGSLAVSAGALFLGSGYLKWWRWLLVALRSTPPTPPGRHHA